MTQAKQDRPLNRRTPLQTWRAFSFVLASVSIASIAIAALLVPYARTPDGRDAFYVGIAWQFAVWGLIDLYFAVSGIRETSKLSRLEPSERDVTVGERVGRLSKLLKSSRWQDAVWLLLGALTLTAGYLFHSAATAGHGVGVIVQALILFSFDRRFSLALRESAGSSEVSEVRTA